MQSLRVAAIFLCAAAAAHAQAGAGGARSSAAPSAAVEARADAAWSSSASGASAAPQAAASPAGDPASSSASAGASAAAAADQAGAATGASAAAADQAGAAAGPSAAAASSSGPALASAADPAAATPALAELPPVLAVQPGELTSALLQAPASLPPVTAQLFHLGGMLEVEPLVLFSVGDAFYRTYAAGFRAEQHLDERWSVSLHALGGGSGIAAPVQLCGGGPCSAPDAARLRSTPGDLQLLAGAELGWAPIYGKISLIGETTMHFDAYLSAGPELLRELIAPDAASAQAGRWNIGGRVSVGERLFVSDRWSVRLAVSELMYGETVRGQREFERKLTLEGGVAFLFGK